VGRQRLILASITPEAYVEAAGKGKTGQKGKTGHRTFYLLFRLAAKKITGMPRTARASRAGYC
jgi:hypothetical protein